MTLDHKTGYKQHKVKLQQYPRIHCMGQNYRFFFNGKEVVCVCVCTWAEVVVFKHVCLETAA